MTVYCYRCGTAVRIEPTLVSIFVKDDAMRVTFAEAIVAHTCPKPQDA